MAPLPVIANVVRCTLNGAEEGGVAPRNVFHLLASGADESDIGASIFNNFQTDQFGVVPGDFVAQSVDILKLDGTSPTVNVPAPEDFDPTGIWGPIGDEWSPADAAVISLRTSVRGPRGRGRLFLGPLREAAMVNGSLAGGGATSLSDAWVAWGSQMALDGFELVVASYTHADANQVTNLHADPGLGTCRRRLLQQR